MFTGLVQALGTVRRPSRRARRPAAASGRAATRAQTEIGESVAVNGACLTVVGARGDSFDFQAGPETLAKTNLGALAPGDRVNLERALRAGDPIGGHFVTGHIDCVGTRAGEDPSGDWLTVWFGYPPRVRRAAGGEGVGRGGRREPDGRGRRRASGSA